MLDCFRRELVLKNNVLLKSPESVEIDSCRDQGFTRPRLLILCPFKSSVIRIVQLMKDILGENTSYSGLEKLLDDFGDNPDEVEEEGKNGVKKEKPLDWHTLFDGNIEDDFKVLTVFLKLENILSHIKF